MSGETRANRIGPLLRRLRLRRAREVPFIAQLTPTDCGAACLSAALAYHGKELPIHAVRAQLGVGRNGVTARQILNAARAYGLRARGVAVDMKTLQYLTPGSILHWELAHFVVFERLDKRQLVIMDPAIGRRRVPLKDVSGALSGVAVVLEPGESFTAERAPRKGRYRRYREWMLGVRGIWSRVLVTSLFLQLFALAVPGLMGAVVDKVVPRADQQLLSLVAAGCLSTASFYFLSSFLRSRLLLHLRTQIEARMSLDFVEHLLALPYAFFQQRTTGDLMMRLSSQAAIRELLTTGALSALLDGALVLVYFALLVGAAPWLALVAAVLALLQVAIVLIAGKRSTELMSEGLATQARLEAYQVEMLAGIETLKSMGAAPRASARWSDLYVEVLNASLARGELDGLFQALVGTLRFAGPVALLLTGAHQVLSGSLSLGVMLALSALGSGFLEPVSNLVNTAMKLTQLKSYMARLEDVLDAQVEPVRPPSAARPLQGKLEVRGLCFQYPSEPHPTLDQLSFSVAPGECVAIVGASGSGKSTLARLLAGLYEPSAGSIAFDDIDLRAWDLRQLRERLGIVTQDTRLFSGTVRDNVTLFEPATPAEAVRSACELACLHGDIAHMPMGYDTVLADGGTSLSGGQRQRLSLARALLRRPDVLILDEATSALDTVTEQRVHTQLRELECTRVVIAHRLSTIIEADKILVLERGRLVGLGRHAELLLDCPAYRALIQAQHEFARPAPEIAAHVRVTPAPTPIGAPAAPGTSAVQTRTGIPVVVTPELLRPVPNVAGVPAVPERLRARLAAKHAPGVTEPIELARFKEPAAPR